METERKHAVIVEIEGVRYYTPDAAILWFESGRLTVTPASGTWQVAERTEFDEGGRGQ